MIVKTYEDIGCEIIKTYEDIGCEIIKTVALDFNIDKLNLSYHYKGLISNFAFV